MDFEQIFLPEATLIYIFSLDFGAEMWYNQKKKAASRRPHPIQINGEMYHGEYYRVRRDRRQQNGDNHYCLLCGSGTSFCRDPSRQEKVNGRHPSHASRRERGETLSARRKTVDGIFGKSVGGFVDGAWTAGAAGNPRGEYARGQSAWTNSHAGNLRGGGQRGLFSA